MSVVITRNIVVGPSVDPIDLDRARICYDNIFRYGHISASSEDIDNDGWLENGVDGLTYDFWRPESLPAWISCDLPAVQEIDYIGIAAHSIVTFVLQQWDGSDWVNVHDPVETTTARPYLVLFDPITTDQVRVLITDSADDVFIGVISVGLSVTMPRPFYGGHRPVTLNKTTSIIRNQTEYKLDAGTYHVKTGAASSVTINHVPASWAQENIERLNQDLAIRPFFFAWRPHSQPDDVAYCWLNSPIQAVNNGNKARMDVSFDFNAHVGVTAQFERTEYGFAITSVTGLAEVPNVEVYDVDTGDLIDGLDFGKVFEPTYSIEHNTETNRVAIACGTAGSARVEIWLALDTAPVLIQTIPSSAFSAGGIQQFRLMRFDKTGNLLCIYESDLRISLWRWDGSEYVRIELFTYVSSNRKSNIGFCFDAPFFWIHGLGTNNLLMYEIDQEDYSVSLFAQQTITELSLAESCMSHDGNYFFVANSLSGTPGFVFNRLFKRTGTTWALVQEIDGQSGAGSDWSKDSRYVAWNARLSIDDNAVIIYERVGDTLVEVFRQPAQQVSSLFSSFIRWSDDGERLVSHRKQDTEGDKQITVVAKTDDGFETLYQQATNNALQHQGLTIIQKTKVLG